jgi:hypothetical protein
MEAPQSINKTKLQMTVPRAQVEVLESAAADGSGDGSAGEPIQIRLGVWISDTKSRRVKLAADKLAQLAELGLDWA